MMMHNHFCVTMDAFRIDLFTRVRIRLQKSLDIYSNFTRYGLTILTIHFQDKRDVFMTNHEYTLPKIKSINRSVISIV